MKLKKVIAIIVFSIVIQFSFGQKVKIKKNVVTIKEETICMVEKDDVNPASFYINNLDNDQKLYFKWVNWSVDSYYEVYKADDLESVFFETNDGVGYRKWIIKKLYNAKVFNSSGIDEKKLNQFAQKIGKEFSRRRNRF